MLVLCCWQFCVCVLSYQSKTFIFYFYQFSNCLKIFNVFLTLYNYNLFSF